MICKAASLGDAGVVLLLMGGQTAVSTRLRTQVQAEVPAGELWRSPGGCATGLAPKAIFSLVVLFQESWMLFSR